MERHERVIGQLRRRIAATLWIKYTLILSTGWLFLWGVGVLATRVVAGHGGVWLAWPALGLIPAAGLAAWIARRRCPETNVLRAALDRRSRGGGLLMTRAERELGAWAGRIPAASAPALRWRGERASLMCAAGGVFVAVAFLVPQSSIAIHTQQPLRIGEDVEQLKKQIHVLKEQELIKKKEARTLKKQLEQVREKASGSKPVRTWKALDHLKRTVKRIADKAAEIVIRRTRKLTQTQALAQALAQGAQKLNPQQLSQAMSHLIAMAQRAALKNQALSQPLPKSLRNALKNAKGLSAKQLGKLIGSLKLSKAQLQKMMRQLKQARLISAKALKKCKGAGKCKSKGLATFLAKNCKGMSMGRCMSLWMVMCRRPGHGGIARGPGPAPLTFGEESSAQGAKFNPTRLPLNHLSLKDNRLIGLSAAAPEVNDSAPVDASSALQNAAAGGGSAAVSELLPQHRDVVRRYFDRNDE